LNLEREHNNLPPLAWDSRNATAAQSHGTAVLEHGELSHQYKGEPELAERLGEAGARFDEAAENLAIADNEEDAHAALMYSPGHRENILSSRYNAVGMNVAEKGNRLYVVQVFSHRLPEYSDEQFQQSVLNSVNEARKERGLHPLAEHANKDVHALACSTSGSVANIVLAGAQGSSMAAFTSSDPSRLPGGLEKYVASGSLHWMSVGACFRPGPKYGYANFWVVVSFGS
jgi:uncharacterized protein YkwD